MSRHNPNSTVTAKMRFSAIFTAAAALLIPVSAQWNNGNNDNNNAAAQDTSALGGMNLLANEVGTLIGEIKRFNGNPGAIPIVLQDAQATIGTLASVNNYLQGLPAFSTRDAFAYLLPAGRLLVQINELKRIMLVQKPLFDRAGATPQVGYIMQQAYQGANAMIGTFVTKIPQGITTRLTPIFNNMSGSLGQIAALYNGGGPGF